MRASKLICTAAALGVASLIGSVRADDLIKRDVHKDYDKSVASISKEAKRMHTEKDALHSVSVETGVPRPKTEEMLDHWPDAGVAGVMIACTISDYSKRDPSVYM